LSADLPSSLFVLEKDDLPNDLLSSPDDFEKDDFPKDLLSSFLNEDFPKFSDLFPNFLLELSFDLKLSELLLLFLELSSRLFL